MHSKKNDKAPNKNTVIKIVHINVLLIEQDSATSVSTGKGVRSIKNVQEGSPMLLVPG